LTADSTEAEREEGGGAQRQMLKVLRVCQGNFTHRWLHTSANALPTLNYVSLPLYLHLFCVSLPEM
jgi:hypothetical protein